MEVRDGERAEDLHRGGGELAVLGFGVYDDGGRGRADDGDGPDHGFWGRLRGDEGDGDEGGVDVHLGCPDERRGHRRVHVGVARLGGGAPPRGGRGRQLGPGVEGRGRRGGCARGVMVVWARGEADALGHCEGEDGIVVREEVRLGEAELVVEDVEELALDAPDIPLAEDTRAECPVDVLQRRVIAVLERGREVSVWDRREGPEDTHLVSKYECSEEYALASPLLERDLQMWLCPVDVDEGHKQYGNLDLCFVEDVGHELCEVGVVGLP